MEEQGTQKQLGIVKGLGRVYRYAVPYWKLILVTFLSMTIYASSLTARAYLAKPLLQMFTGSAQELSKTLSLKGALRLFKEKTVPTEGEKGEGAQQMEQLARSRLHSLLPLVLMALGVTVLVSGFGFIKDYVSAYVSNRMVIDLQCDLCNKFLTMPMAFHTKLKKGEVFSRLNSDVGRAAVSFQLIFGDLLQEPLTLIVGIAAMFMLNWQLTLLLGLSLPPLVILTVRFGKKIRKKSTKRQEMVGVLMGSMIQMFSGIKVVKAFGMEAYEGDRFRRINMELFKRIMKVEKTGATSRYVTEFLNHATAIFLIGAGALAVTKSLFGLSFAVLGTFVALAITLYKPVKNLSQAYNKISDSMAGIQRVYEIMDLEPNTMERQGTRQMQGVEKGIRFEHVYFSYDGTRTVLKDIDFEIRKGDTVALVGKTGVGKTTLSDLILGFYHPTSGAIYIDDVDIREFTRESLLRHIAVVTQEPFLFDTSVEENIRYGKPDATRQEIEEAAKAAYIHDVIMSLPQGYTSHVGDRGTRLSGGERQRITIARAILRNPSILILDEATAALDAESEKLVRDAVENLMRGRTTVVIAHRFSTIKNADMIVVLEDGRISMMGTHEELILKGGLYKELCEMQFLPDAQSSAPSRGRTHERRGLS
jgi:subfamily B ATP-binding cassette protein MsbA